MPDSRGRGRARDDHGLYLAMRCDRSRRSAQNEPGLTAWVDGECALCCGLRDWVLAHDPGTNTSFLDLTRLADDELVVSRAEHQRRLWVRRTGGELCSGFDAVLSLLDTLPRWKVVSWLARAPLVRPVGRWVYDMVARHRRRRPRGVPHVPEPDTPDENL